MGQYHVLVNFDKREYVNPHKLGDGLKLWEQAASGDGGVGSALLVLIAGSVRGGARGGGDVDDETGLAGSWAGDRIALVGDYAEKGDFGSDEMDLLATEFNERNEGDDRQERGQAVGWADVSEAVKALLGPWLGIKWEGEGWQRRMDLESGEGKRMAMKPDIMIVTNPQGGEMRADSNDERKGG